jgi:hypothetical protein
MGPLGKTSPKSNMAGDLINLIGRQWADAEEAKNIAATVLRLGEAEFLPLAAPWLKGLSAKQRAIALALFASLSKTGGRQLGDIRRSKLMQAAVDYAALCRERTYFNDVMEALNPDRNRW